MATFSKSSFNASLYSLWRPTYPNKLYEFIFDYHRRSSDARWERAIDIGCGTGQATVHLLDKFRKVIGVDPSQGMVQKARDQFDSQFSGSPNGTAYRFVQGQAEDMKHVIKEDSVDLVISAQAAHWFDYGKVWPETRRVLRKGGTVAFWVYSEMRFPSHPSLTPLITQYAQGSDPKTSLGPHFQRPGRTILENHLLDVPNPDEYGFQDIERVFFTGDYYPSLPAEKTHPVLMGKEMRWRDLLSYLRTWSALHTYHELYPEDAVREPDPRFPEDLSIENSKDPQDTDVRGGDIVVRFWKDLRENAQKDGALVGLNDKVQMEWPVALILARKGDDGQ